MNASNLHARVVAIALAISATAAPVMAQEVALRGTLGGGNVISATESPATGEVAAVLDEDGSLQLDLVFDGLELGATGAALHMGKYNENGPMVAELEVDNGATAGRIMGQQIALTNLTASAVREGDSYVVVSTIQYPNGAIRAQLMPQPVRLGTAPAPESPGSTIPATAPEREPEQGVEEAEEGD